MVALNSPSKASRKKISRVAILIPCLAVALGHETAIPQEPHETVRTEFGSEYSDGSSTIVGDSASFTSNKGSVLLNIDSARPVERAVSTLQTRYGRQITYEDPPYTNEDDLEDVSAKVVRNYSKYAPGTAPKVIIPRGGKLTLRLPIASNIGSRDLAPILQQLVRTQGSSSRGGHFRVEQVGDAFHVIPVEVRDRNGNWSHHSSPLDTPISLPQEERSGGEVLNAICGAVSTATATHVRFGSLPINLLMQFRGTLSAENEPARSVLWRALNAMNRKLTWMLLYDFDSDGYFLSVLIVPDQNVSAPVLQPDDSTHRALKPPEQHAGTDVVR